MKTTCTKKEFKSWLESKNSDALAGVSSEKESCPLAMYFRTINNLKKGDVKVCSRFILIHKEENEPLSRENKPWMNKFIRQVDGWPCCITNTKGSYNITAKKALDFLSKC